MFVKNRRQLMPKLRTLLQSLDEYFPSVIFKPEILKVKINTDGKTTMVLQSKFLPSLTIAEGLPQSFNNLFINLGIFVDTPTF